jgi:hypothetical protein
VCACSPLPADTQSVSQIAASSNALIAVVQHIFHTIDKMNVFPKVIPAGQAQRFRLASQLSQMVGALGFKGEHAFQSFLYPAEKVTSCNRALSLGLQRSQRQGLMINSQVFKVFRHIT